MDVVYVLGKGSQWNDNELRYSLRSICMYGKGLQDVYIIGDYLPDFIDPDKVRFIRVPDLYPDAPYINVAWKISCAFRYTDLDEFLLSSDDHFFIKPVDFDHWPVHYKGDWMPSEAQINDTTIGDARYRRVMINTRRFMERVGLDTKFYEGHTNKLYTREAYDWLCHPDRDRVMQDIVMPGHDGVCMNSPMAATIMKLHPDYPCIHRKDIKLRHLNMPEDFDLIHDAESFSIYNSAIRTGVAGFLECRFPEKCRFELLN